MSHYAKLLKSLNFKNEVIQCAEGIIVPPLATFQAPVEWYGFPPALIPIWSDGSRSTYIGVWKHWFIDRKQSFVKMYVGANRMTIEVARTTDQLFAIIAMMSISENDGITDNLIDFAKKVEINNLEQIDSVSLVSGDEPHGLVMIDQFDSNVPFESVSAVVDYSGDFPSGIFDDSKPWWLKSCSFEIPPNVLAAWPFDVPKPSWIENSNKGNVDLFNDYLNDCDFWSAWLILNSSGWDIMDARMAISNLRNQVKNSKFDLLVDAWLSVTDESVGGY
jgi:hypothetical protein